jgi:hypothetical protein
MSEFRRALKADLLEARTRVALVLLGAALVGAVIYAVLGGGASTAPPTPASSPGTGPGSSGIAAVAAPPNSRTALAEVTSGASLQRGGGSRDPFTPLPGSAATLSSPSSSAKSKSSGSSSTGKSQAGKPTEEASQKPTKHSKPTKPKTVHHVEVRFGPIAAGTPPQSAQLRMYDGLKSKQTLPSAGVPLVAFEGVTAGGRRAKFKLVGEVFLRGMAACVPSVSLCRAITLGQGQSEELEYLPAGAPPVVYDLQVVSITSKSSPGASARRGARHARAALAGEPVAAIATAGLTGASAGYASAFATRSAR